MSSNGKATAKAMTRETAVFCSAQHFGFGPTTALIAIERAISRDKRAEKLRLILNLNPALNSVLGQETSRFELIHSNQSFQNPLDLIHSSRSSSINAVVSSYDSAAIFLGWFLDVPTIFFDGLFWFWEWEERLKTVFEHLTLFSKLKATGDKKRFVCEYEALAKADYHSTTLIAYYLASKVCAVRGLGSEERLNRFPAFRNKIRLVPAVLDRSFQPMPLADRSHILVSLSGSLAPLMSFEQNLLFAKGVLDFTVSACKRSQKLLKLPWVFACHPQILQALERESSLMSLPSSFRIVPSLSYSGNLEAIRAARAFLVSPGSTSIQEAAYLQTPVFFLPEQNCGQPQQLQKLRRAKYESTYSWTVTDQLYSGECNLLEHDIDTLYTGIEELFNSCHEQKRDNLIDEFLFLIREDSDWEKLTKAQARAVVNVFGGFDGANYVVDTLLDIV